MKSVSGTFITYTSRDTVFQMAFISGNTKCRNHVVTCGAIAENGLQFVDGHFYNSLALAQRLQFFNTKCVEPCTYIEKMTQKPLETIS